MKWSFAVLASLAALGVRAATVSDVTVSQDAASKVVTVGYALADGPAIITLEVKVNGVALEPSKVWSLSGDVNTSVASGTGKRIVWRPAESWPGQTYANGEVSVRVKAWPLDDPPEYMAIDLVEWKASYYTCAEAVPGGIAGNGYYKTDAILMKRIRAKNVTWTMGASKDVEKAWDQYRETVHAVTMTNDYYIGVYEVTQHQWLLGTINIPGTLRSTPSTYASLWTTLQGMRPVECIAIDDIRHLGVSGGGREEACLYPNAPSAKSFLGYLRTKTGLAVDLPSNAQWEYACRGGHGQGQWGDGSAIAFISSGEDPNLTRLGRYAFNGGAEKGTAVVGSYAPNDYGLYDMHGNVDEWCLDFRSYAAKYFNADGTPNCNLTKYAVDGANGEGIYYTLGGHYNAEAYRCRPSAKSAEIFDSTRASTHGFRIALTLP